MAKEILLYGDLYGYSAEQIINHLIEAKNSNVVLRFNGDGGEIRMGWGIIAKLKELKGEKLFKNDGEANSMLAFAFCYNKNNEAIDTATFGFHRASYGEYYEKSEYFTTTERTELTEKNAKLREAMEAKMDIGAFERITNTTLNQLFSLETRVNICLTAKQALECKLIERIVTITPEYSAEIRTLAAHYKMPIAAKTDPIPTPKIMEITSKVQLKAQYPDLYKEIFAAGVKHGIAKENERVAPMFAYFETNPAKIEAAFKSGKPMDEVMKMECIQKSITAQAVKTIEDENAPDVTTAAESPEKQAAAAKADPVKTASTAKFNSAMDAEFKKMYPNSKKVA